MKSRNDSHSLVLLSFLSELLLAAGKAVGVFYTGSAVLAAETAHSTASAVDRLLLTIVHPKARKRADAALPCGSPRAAYLPVFTSAVILFTLGAVAALSIGGWKLWHPLSMRRLPIAAAVLFAALLVRAVSLQRLVKRINLERGGLPLTSFVARTRHPELTLLFRQELTAVLTLIAAVLILGVQWLTHSVRPDAIAAMVSAVAQMVLAILTAAGIKALLPAEEADPRLLEDVYTLLGKEESIRRVVGIRSLQMSDEEIVLTVKAEFDDRLTALEIANLTAAIEKDIRRQFPTIQRMFIAAESLKKPAITY